MSNITKFAEEMATAESKYAHKLRASAQKVASPLIKTIMNAVSEDSLKHSMIYESIIEILKSESPLINEAELQEISKEIENHIRMEAEMIKLLEDILKKGVKNKPVRFLLETILRDEIYHHALLRGVYEIIIKKEALTESDIWDLIWKDVSFHGAPGG
jgi:rubrerythrin